MALTFFLYWQPWEFLVFFFISLRSWPQLDFYSVNRFILSEPSQPFCIILVSFPFSLCTFVCLLSFFVPLPILFMVWSVLNFLLLNFLLLSTLQVPAQRSYLFLPRCHKHWVFYIPLLLFQYLDFQYLSILQYHFCCNSGWGDMTTWGPEIQRGQVTGPALWLQQSHAPL